MKKTITIMLALLLGGIAAQAQEAGYQPAARWRKAPPRFLPVTLAAGIYVVQLSTATDTHTAKVVVK